MLPNAGSFGLAVSSAILLGLISLMLLDTSLNMAMQPFKMLVGDMVNERQKGLAYAIQSFLSNAGSVVGFILPFILAWLGCSNIAALGVVPDTVIYSFYIGAVIVFICVVFSLIKIKEWPPAQYAAYNGEAHANDSRKRPSLLSLLRNAPSTFWQIFVVQFFCWVAFLFMWTYTNGTIAKNAFQCPTTVTMPIFSSTGAKAMVTSSDDAIRLDNGDILAEHGALTDAGRQYLATHEANATVELNADSQEYNDAGNWVGILYAIQAIGSAIWSVVIALFRNRKLAYSLSLILGAIGFISMAYITDQYLLCVSFLLIGCAWTATFAFPLTILTNALNKGNIGSYLGLFACSISLPQIIGALSGGKILSALSGVNEVAPQAMMIAIAGISMLVGAICVWFIKEHNSKIES
jgi:maltose/moltooligosaccharide transporter